MWLKKALSWLLFCVFVFMFLILAATACQAEEQELHEAGSRTIEYLKSVEREERIENDKAMEGMNTYVTLP